MHLLRRKIFFAIMLVLILIGAYFGYQYFVSKTDQSLKYIPGNAVLILQLPLNNFNTDKVIQSTNYWNSFSAIPSVNNYTEQVFAFEDFLKKNKSVRQAISKSKLFISAFPTKANDFDLLYVAKLNKNVSESLIDSILVRALKPLSGIEKRNFNGEIISEMELPVNSSFSYSLINNYLIASYTTVLVDDAITQFQDKTAIGFQELLISGFESNQVELKLIYKNIPSFLKLFSDKRSGERGINVLEFYNLFSNYKIKVDSNYVLGTSLIDKSIDRAFVSNFAAQKSKESNLFNVLPASTAVVKQVSVSNLGGYLNTLKNDKSKVISGYAIDEYIEGLNNKFDIDVTDYLTDWCNGNFAQVILEPVNTNYDSFVFAFFEADNIDNASEKLKELAKISFDSEAINKEEYNDYELIQINLQNALPLLYGNIFSRVQDLNYILYDNFVIFGNSKDALKLLIDEYNLGTLLADRLTNNEIAALNNKSNHYTFFTSIPNSDNLMRAHLNSKWFVKYKELTEGLGDLNSFIYSYKYDDTKPASSFLISFSQANKEKVKIAWSVNYDQQLITEAFVVKGNQSKIYNVLVQDKNNILYCLDESGKQLWSKKINGKIISDVDVLDIRYNGQTQYLFNTNAQVYLIDDNGANQINYPIKLPAETNHSIVIYENEETKDIRYYANCNNQKLYAYQINGRIISKFKLNGSNQNLVRNVQIVNLQEPYLILSKSDSSVTLFTLDGDLVKQHKHDHILSAYNEFYVDENNFVTTTDELGNVISISTSGVLNMAPNPSLSNNHFFYFADVDNDGNKDYIYLDENELTVYDTEMIMILYKSFQNANGNKLKVVQVEGENTLAVVSSSSNKMYLLDKSGINKSGFPLEGSSLFKLVDLQNTGNLNLVCVSGNNKVINYRIK